MLKTTMNPMTLEEAAGGEALTDELLLAADPAALHRVRTRRLGVHRARVERIRDQIATGTYAVDADAVADALLARLRAVGRL